MAVEDPADPFAFVRPLPESHEWLPCGAVRPAGWLAAQMRRDLEEGFVGRLDELLPALLRDDDLYGRDRLSRSVSRKELEAPWLDPPTVDVELHEPATGSRLRAQLLPLGSTILRQVTFPAPRRPRAPWRRRSPLP